MTRIMIKFVRIIILFFTGRKKYRFILSIEHVFKIYYDSRELRYCVFKTIYHILKNY